MSSRKNINRILKPLIGYEISKVEFGRDLWPDVKTILARDSIETVFDVGANEGQSARQFLRHFPNARIFSFEPAPTAFQALAAFAQTNPRLTPVNVALGAAPGRAQFHENAFHQTNSFLPAASRSREYLGPNVLACRGKIEVEVTTLDAFCRRETVEKIALLKIDVQGFELNVLKGARECLAGAKIGCIVLEVNFVPLYENQSALHEITALLAEHQYDLCGFYDFAHDSHNHLMWCEAVFSPRVRPA